MTTGDDADATCYAGSAFREEHLHVIDPHPKRHAENVEIVRREVEHPRPERDRPHDARAST